MTATTVQAESRTGVPVAQTQPATAAEAAARFRPFRRRAMAGLAAALPWAALGISAVLEIGLILSGAGFDVMFAAGALATALTLGLSGMSLARFPRAFLDLWNRNLLRAREADGAVEAEARLVAFLMESEAWLNHRLASILGLGVMVVTIAAFWPFGIGTPADWADSLARYPSAWLAILFYLVVYALGFLAGWLAWRPVALVMRLGAAGAVFDFDLSIEHPDRCGGLKTLGDLGLLIALLLAGPAWFLGGWAIALGLIPMNALEQWKLPFAGLAAACVALALAGFFGSGAGVSRAMRRQRARVQAHLDSIGQQIDRLAKSLLDNAERLDPAEGRAQEEKLEFLRRVYARNRRVPVWPFDWLTLLKLFVVQLVPLAGLVIALLTLR